MNQERGHNFADGGGDKYTVGCAKKHENQPYSAKQKANAYSLYGSGEEELNRYPGLISLDNSRHYIIYQMTGAV
ncbi:MAG: hypothetical protein C0399_01565 [Syntrophus sp. (in: bacteria)]|nr:hypothetical protein [Syntrophus sp. (in: bacteria)]